MITEEVYTCIICPMACTIKVRLEDGKIVEISGYSCPRGKAFVEKEITSPERMVTSTVAVRGGILPQLPVRTKTPVPKNKIFDVMAEIRKVAVDAPVKMGDVIIKNAANTGVDVIAERDIPAAEK